MKVAIIHYWLVHMRGGEKVLQSLCRLFPDADIFTHAYDPRGISETIRRHSHTLGAKPFFFQHFPAFTQPRAGKTRILV